MCIQHTNGKSNNLKYQYEIYCLISIIIISLYTIISVKPTKFGDCCEYFIMVQSLFNHLSPDARIQDYNDIVNISRNSSNFSLAECGRVDVVEGEIEFIKGHSKSRSGKLYSYHFWFYPLCALPFKVFLRIFNLSEIRTFQLTNMFFFLLALSFVVYKMRNYPHKTIFLILCYLNPVLWYIRLPHPETFIYSLSLISIIFYLNRKYIVALIFSSLGAMQFQPLIFLYI